MVQNVLSPARPGWAYRCPSPGSGTTQYGQGDQMIDKITILRGSNGQYWFRVTATNGKIICHSEQYYNYTDCYHAAQIVQNGGGTIQ